MVCKWWLVCCSGLLGHAVLAMGRSDASAWMIHGLRTENFSKAFLRQSAGNYVNSTSCQGWTFCWDNFSQFGGLVRAAHATMLYGSPSGSTAFALGALDDAAMILQWQLAVMWKNNEPGGFFSAAWSNGQYTYTEVQYSDDNCFAGVTLLESFYLLRSQPLVALTNSSLSGSGYTVGQLATLCKETAWRCAAWATSPSSNAWDSQEGGFWWNVSTVYPPPYSMRPDNSLWLCTNLFSELFSLTGNETMLLWAQKSLEWGVNSLFDPQLNLFNWYVDAAGVINTTKFAYSNALAAYAIFRLGSCVPPLSKLITFGLAVAQALSHFYSTVAQAYVESTEVDWAISTTLSGWASKSILPIAHAVNDSQLAGNACSNLAFVQNFLFDDNNGAFLDSAFLNGEVPAEEFLSFTTLNSAWGLWLSMIGSEACAPN